MASITIQIEGDNQSQRVFQQVIKDMDELFQRVRRFSTDAVRVLDLQRRAVDGVRSAYTRLRGVLGSVLRTTARIGAVGILGGAAAGGAFAIRAATEVDTLRDSLIAFTGSVDEANQRLERLRELANLPGVSFRGAALAAVQLEGVSLEAERAEGLIRGLGNALALVGRSDLSPAVRAISQIISRGEVLQEEINQLVEATPIASRALTQEFGTTLAENIRGQLEGGVDEFITRLSRALDRLPRANLTGAANVFQNFQNAVRDLAGQIGELALPDLTNAVQQLTTSINENAAAIRQNFASAIEVLRNIFSVVQEQLPGIISGLQTLVGGRLLLGGASGVERLGVSLTDLGVRGTRIVSAFAGLARVLGSVGVAASAIQFAPLLIQLASGTNTSNQLTRALTNTKNAIQSISELIRDRQFQNAISRLRQEFSDLGITLREIYELQGLTNITQRLSELQTELAGVPQGRSGARRRAELNEEIELLRAQQAVLEQRGRGRSDIPQEVQQQITLLRVRRESLAAELETERGLGRRRSAQRTELRNQIRQIDEVLNTYSLLRLELDRLNNAQERLSRGSVIPAATPEQTAEIRNFALELLNADETVRQLQDRFRGFSQIDLSFFETLTQLNDALGERVAVALAPIDRQIQEQEEIANNARASEEARADAETRLRELAVERRRVVIQYEREITEAYQRETDLREQAATRESQGRISFAERSRQRQLAIGRDLGERARVLTRQRIQADLTDARNESAEQQRIQFDSNRRVLESIFNRVYEERTATRQNVDAYTAMADRILSQYERIAAGASRVARRTQEAFRLAAARQTRDQRSVVEDFVGTDDEDNLRARLRPLYDAYIKGKERTAELSVEITDRQVEAEIDIYRQFVDSTLDLALERDRSFREVAGQFLRQSVRIIVQSFFETQVLIRNNERLIASNLRVAQSRSQAFGVLPAGSAGGVSNLLSGFGGGSLTGGLGALGVAGLLFPNEFANLGQGISQVFSSAARSVVNSDIVSDNIVIENNIQMSDGTLRKLGNRTVQNERRRR